MTQPPPTLWERIRDRVLSPKVDQRRLTEHLNRIRQQLPTPVFWLLGNAQSGKTSLIRALTGSTRAEIGNGIRPCTRTAQLYFFPTEDECFLKFLDTRGLGEALYDPADDMRICEEQAHLLIVVIKALDHAQLGLLQTLDTILKAHPAWPVIVVQSSLHEGYPTSTTAHVLPYPYDRTPLPDFVPPDLARSLAAQRHWFDGRQVRFVPIDFTLPEDGYQPEHYGLDALWQAIEEALPEGIRGMIEQFHLGRQQLRDMHLAAAQPHIISYALAAGGAAAVPVPWIDLPLVIAIQAKMFHTIASIYGQELSARRMAEIGGAIGLGYLGRLGTRELAKLVPGFGSAVSAVYASATTYAMGRTLCEYFARFQAGNVPGPDTFRQLYDEQFQQARQWLKGYYGQRTGAASDSAGDSRP